MTQDACGSSSTARPNLELLKVLGFAVDLTQSTKTVP